MTRLFLPIILSLSLFIAGCSSDMKRDLGLAKTAPDEFEVVASRPLIMPPNFSLRPPVNAAESQTPSKKFSSGEESLLQHMNVATINPHIRQSLEDDHSAEQETDSWFKIPFLKDKKKEEVIDPQAEKERRLP